MVLLNLLVKPVWLFLIDRNVQSLVGHHEYGLYNALLGLTLIFSSALDLGITNYNNKSLAEDNSLLDSKLPNMIAGKAILAGLYFLIVLGWSFILQYHGRAIRIVFLLAVVQMLNSFLLFLRSNVSAHHHFKTDALLSVLDKVLMIAICGLLLLNPAFKSKFVIEWFVYAQIVAYFIAVCVALGIIVRRYTRINFSHFSMHELIRVCRKSLPYAVLILLMAIYMRSDLLMLERLEGADKNSIYAQPYRILDAVNMIAFLFAGMLLPMFSRMIAQKAAVGMLVSTTANIMLSASLALVGFSIVYGGELLRVLYSGVDHNLVVIFCFVIGSFPAFCVMHIYSTLLTANGDIALLIKIALAGSLLSIGLNFFLITSLHAVGASITCFVVNWLLAIIYIFFCIKKFSLQTDYRRISKFALVFVLQAAANYLLYLLHTPLLGALPVNIGLFLMIVYSIRLWDKRIITSYLKQYKVSG